MTNLSERNLERLRKNKSIIENFVKEHNGEWNHSDWLNFCSFLEESGYTPVDLDQVGLLLEAEKARRFPKHP